MRESKRKKHKKYIKIVVAFSCILLIGILIFPEGLVGVMRGGKQSPSVVTEEFKTVTIHFPEKELNYDGTGNINLMEGVTAMDSSGEEVTGQIKTSIVAGEDQNHKVVEYTVTLDGRTTKATRTMVLENYKKPWIEVTKNLQVQAQDLDYLVEKLSETEQLKADDGYGNDITKIVEFQYHKVSDQGNSYLFTFSLYNYFGDYAQATAVGTIQGLLGGPSVELSQEAVKLQRGSAFSPYSYIVSATDPNDGDITDLIEISGDVDMNTPGQYTVSYTAVNRSGQRGEPTKLIVYVE